MAQLFRFWCIPNLIIKEGKFAGLRGIIINITELKQVEQALRESEGRFKNMFERHSSVYDAY